MSNTEDIQLWRLEFLSGGPERLDGRPVRGFTRGGFGVFASPTGAVVALHVGDTNLTDNERRRVAQMLADALTDAQSDRAEVVRLRERDAAWEWLAAKGYDVRKRDFMDGAFDYAAFKANLGNVVGCRATAPDPVALCDKLDANWRKA